MEAELLRSKTEMMLLNNQLLEAVQKRLELSLELEAWKVNLRKCTKNAYKKKYIYMYAFIYFKGKGKMCFECPKWETGNYRVGTFECV